MGEHEQSTRVGRDRGFSRRQFLGLVAASVAAEAAACRRAVPEKIVPYVRRPKDVHPGEPTVYATSIVLDGWATGVLVSCRDGRPIKVEGNPDHPASLGGTSPIHQAYVLGLYDPDRAHKLSLRGGAASWTALRRVLAEQRERRGDGLRLLMPRTSSPLLAELMSQVERACPGVRFACHSPMDTGHARAGAELAYGRPVEQLYDFATAEVVVALDADFLAQGPFCLRHAHAWSALRQPGSERMSRLYCAETMLTVTGSMAEHRLPVPPSGLLPVTLQLAAEVLAALPASRQPAAVVAALARWRKPDDPWIAAAARDLVQAAGKGVVLVGERQPAELHALVHLLNRTLGHDGHTVRAVPSALVRPAHAMDVNELTDELRRGEVRTLLMLEGNPSYDMPADVDFRRLLRGVPTSVYLGDYENETFADVQWFVPAAHAFASWGDARALDGTVSLVQPLIARLHGEQTSAEMLAALAHGEPPSVRQLLREAVARESGRAASNEDATTRWQEALRAGLVAGSAFAPLHLPLGEENVASGVARLQPASGLELNLLPDPAVYDGRFTNNGWLLELPRPITSVCWGNAAYLGPVTASALGVKTEDECQLELGGHALRVPAFVLDGHAEGAVTLHFGYGRGGAEHLARGVGANAHALQVGHGHFFGGLALRPTGKSERLAIRQLERRQHGREIAMQRSLDRYRRSPEDFAAHRGPLPSLIPEKSPAGEQWAMSIDLGRCIGCGACVVACQAENNIPIVGAREVRLGRAMHWLRIDSYLEGTAGQGLRVVHQPMPCQHCANAPCEYVCPVNATVHSPDGLNEMVYNRCVGTRFCSNNCPYKVRRFNWFNWYEEQAANQGGLRLQRNPEVTVRDRGVMEKCTYCVQRIRRAQLSARLEDRALRPGEVRTACQQACPTQAIAFGALGEEDRPVVQRRREARAYELLHDQGTRPRTWYLARIDNPNPTLERHG